MVETQEVELRKEAEPGEEAATHEPDEEAAAENELVKFQHGPVPTKSGSKEPAERFQSADELARLLGQHLRHLRQPTAPAPPNKPTPPTT